MDSSEQQHTHLLLLLFMEDAHQTTESYFQSDLRPAGRSSQLAPCTRITCWDSSYVSPSGSSIASPWPSMASCPYSSGCRDRIENSSVVTEAIILPCELTCCFIWIFKNYHHCQQRYSVVIQNVSLLEKKSIQLSKK